MVNPKLCIAIEDNLSDIQTCWPSVETEQEQDTPSTHVHGSSSPLSPSTHAITIPSHASPRSPLNESGSPPSWASHSASPSSYRNRHHFRKTSTVQGELDSLRCLCSVPCSPSLSGSNSPSDLSCFASMVEAELATRARADADINAMGPGEAQTHRRAHEFQRRLQWAEKMLIKHPEDCAMFYTARAKAIPMGEAIHTLNSPRLFAYELGPAAAMETV